MKVLREKRILVAALDWGLGHATRCVPIIRNLQENGYEIILASAGSAKDFFTDYFPELKVIEKPAYNISYPENGAMASALLRQTPAIIKTIRREHRWLKQIISEHKITEVISDNCYGLWNKKIHSTLMTHQLMIKCPDKLKFLEPILHRIVLSFVNRYDECYVPDLKSGEVLSGDLSHKYPVPKNVRFIGPQSRFSNNEFERSVNIYDVVVLLSGPEPQRTLLENKCEKLLQGKNKKVCIIRGKPRDTETKKNTEDITWFNHLPDDKLKNVIMNAKKLVCRPGYSTLMDLKVLGVKALLIPTPGQTEQDYLAEYHQHSKQFETVSQDELSENDLLQDFLKKGNAKDAKVSQWTQF